MSLSVMFLLRRRCFVSLVTAGSGIGIYYVYHTCVCVFVSEGELGASATGQSRTAREQCLGAGGGAEADEGTDGAAEIYSKLSILVRHALVVVVIIIFLMI